MTQLDAELKLANEYYESAWDARKNPTQMANLISKYEAAIDRCKGLGADFDYDYCRANVLLLKSFHRALYDRAFDSIAGAMKLHGKDEHRAREAIQLLDHALGLRNDHSRARIARAMLLIELGYPADKRRAREDINYLLEHAGGDEETYIQARRLDDNLKQTESSTGCFIATAAYGAPDAPEVTLLREFRDRILSTTRAGRAFIGLYYRTSPPVARLLSRSPVARMVVRVLLLAPLGRMAQRALDNMSAGR